MNDNNIRNLRVFYDGEDFKSVWLRIGTDIKIRKVDHLNDIPEFHKLPNILQNEIKSKMNINDNGYKIFSYEQYFYNSHVILFTNERTQWIAILQDIKPSVNMRALFISIGIGSMFFIWNLLKYLNNTQESKYDNYRELETQNSLKYTNTFDNIASYIWNNFFGVALSIVVPVLAFNAARKWLSTDGSNYNKLVKACMLKKLESISNSQ